MARPAHALLFLALLTSAALLELAQAASQSDRDVAVAATKRSKPKRGSAGKMQDGTNKSVKFAECMNSLSTNVGKLPLLMCDVPFLDPNEQHTPAGSQRTVRKSLVEGLLDGLATKCNVRYVMLNPPCAVTVLTSSALIALILRLWIMAAVAGAQRQKGTKGAKARDKQKKFDDATDTCVNLKTFDCDDSSIGSPTPNSTTPSNTTDNSTDYDTTNTTNTTNSIDTANTTDTGSRRR